MFSKGLNTPTFSHNSGLYKEPIYVEIYHNQNNCTIRYTLNGNDPDINSKEYKDPIFIDSTTILRACIINEAGNQSSILTRSFFINVEKDLPIVSLVSDSLNLWDTVTGIYHNSLRNIRRIGNFEFIVNNKSVINQLVKISISGNVAKNHE